MPEPDESAPRVSRGAAAPDDFARPERPTFAERDTQAPRLQSATMRLGSTVPAPLGFLRFCAAWPDQCGLSSGGETTEDRDRTLTSRYYWNIVFQHGTAPA